MNPPRSVTLLGSTGSVGTQTVDLLTAAPPDRFRVVALVAGRNAERLAAQARAPNEWKRWYWACFAGIIFFLLCIPLLHGRWRPSDARRDEEEHEAVTQAELAKLNA